MRPRVSGLVLAAGGGRRMGLPKALVRDHDGVPWVVGTVRTLREGGCDDVHVVVGAQAPEVSELLLPEDVTIVASSEWTEGMARSLASGLASIQDTDSEAVLVHLVDLPDVHSDVIARILERNLTPESLARATFDGEAGHPVLIGRHHWPAVIREASGDSGARAYLASHRATTIECGDLATGHDIDTITELDLRVNNR